MYIGKTSNSISCRTDLANECLELHFGNRRPDHDGIESRTERNGGITCDILEITNESGAVKLGKPVGRYMTLDIGKITQYTRERFEHTVNICAEKLSELLPAKGSCLLACLGNRKITADSQGPLCAEHFIVSRHIKESAPELFSALALKETVCIVPGVLGDTGVEAAHVIRGVTEKAKPDFVIAVDSLAARKVSRVGTTLQISNAGIAPGSGVGNHRTALNLETVGVPVISIGIPTVVDAITVCADVLSETFGSAASEKLTDKTKSDILGAVLSSGSYGYFVTPKNSDEISGSAARLIGFTINKALNPDLEISDMEELLG